MILSGRPSKSLFDRLVQRQLNGVRQVCQGCPRWKDASHSQEVVFISLNAIRCYAIKP
jgi:hypothetical protein